MMDYELSNYIYLKLLKKYMYEKSPRTDAQYEKRKVVLKKQLAEAKKNYKNDPTEATKKQLKKVLVRIRYNISRSEYLRVVEDIEVFKKQYPEIPESSWNFFDFLCIREGIKRGHTFSEILAGREFYE